MSRIVELLIAIGIACGVFYLLNQDFPESVAVTGFIVVLNLHLIALGVSRMQR